jgi:hypothetical protein
MKKTNSEKITRGTVLSLALGLTLFALRTSAQIEPNAGQWKTWVLTSGSQLRLPTPPGRDESREEIQVLEKLAEQRDAATLDLIKFWDAGAPSYQWNQMTINEIKKFGVGTVRAERALALVHVAIYDAMVAAWDSKYAYNRPRPSRLDKDLATVIPNPHSPSYPSEHAVAAGAASAVLAYLFPTDAQAILAQADAAGRSRLLAGVQYPTDVQAGMDLGHAVAALVIAGAQSDGSSAIFSGTIPNGPCNWKGTNPAEPLAGTWKTWVLSSGSEFRPGPPPACDSAQEAAELAEVKSFPRVLPAAGAAFAPESEGFFWQGRAVAFWSDLHRARLGLTRFRALPGTIRWWPAGMASIPTGLSGRSNWMPRRKPCSPRRIIPVTPPPTLVCQEETRVRSLTCFHRMRLLSKRKQAKRLSRAFGPEFTSAVTSTLV